MATDPKTVKYIEEFRQTVSDREDSDRRAWDETASRLREVREHMEARNYGLADQALESLLEDLPHDNGGPVTHTPMLDRHLAQTRAWRAEREKRAADQPDLMRALRESLVST